MQTLENEKLISVTEFVKANGITMTAERVDANPSMDDAKMDHWKCVLSRKVLREGFDTFHGYKGKLGAIKYSTRKITTIFSMGYGHGGREPEVGEVLACLASDARSVKWDSFEGWCGDMGYDADSRKAERIYKACEKIGEKLERFLGADVDEALKGVEMDY